MRTSGLRVNQARGGTTGAVSAHGSALPAPVWPFSRLGGIGGRAVARRSRSVRLRSASLRSGTVRSSVIRAVRCGAGTRAPFAVRYPRQGL
jgi:hypothetical protein